MKRKELERTTEGVLPSGRQPPILGAVSDGTVELVQRAKAGDEEAYERLFESVGERLLIYARCRMGPVLARELEPFDVVQETYLEAHRSFQSFEPRGEGSLLRWMFAIVDNRMRDLADRHAAKKRAPPGPRAGSSEVLERLRSSSSGPSSVFARKDEQARVVEALDGLEAQAREAVLLRFFHQKTLTEVAATLGTSERTVGRLLGEAQVAIGRLLQGGSS